MAAEMLRFVVWKSKVIMMVIVQIEQTRSIIITVPRYSSPVNPRQYKRDLLNDT